MPDGPPVRFRWRRAVYHVAAPRDRNASPRNGGATAPTSQRATISASRIQRHRFWLFREGLFGRETTAPRWYLHGVFG